jgi:hypothetical protein
MLAEIDEQDYVRTHYCELEMDPDNSSLNNRVKVVADSDEEGLDETYEHEDVEGSIVKHKKRK